MVFHGLGCADEYIPSPAACLGFLASTGKFTRGDVLELIDQSSGLQSGGHPLI